MRPGPTNCRRGIGAALRAIPAYVVLSLLAACSSLLPSSQETAESPWESFEEAKAAYDSIVPAQTTAEELKGIGYDPFNKENVRVLSYLDVVERFMPQGALKPEDLDPGLRDCLAAREACWAIEVAPGVVKKRREGFVLLDMFGFRRETITTGWRFSAVVVLENSLVRYKIWDGAPRIDETKVEKKPLGPLQNLDEIVAPRSIVVP